jgi:hypothetical protein
MDVPPLFAHTYTFKQTVVALTKADPVVHARFCEDLGVKIPRGYSTAPNDRCEIHRYEIAIFAHRSRPAAQ